MKDEFIESTLPCPQHYDPTGLPEYAPAPKEFARSCATGVVEEGRAVNLLAWHGEELYFRITKGEV